MKRDYGRLVGGSDSDTPEEGEGWPRAGAVNHRWGGCADSI
jgi:hypothetical protein